MKGMAYYWSAETESSFSRGRDCYQNSFRVKSPNCNMSDEVLELQLHRALAPKGLLKPEKELGLKQCCVSFHKVSLMKSYNCSVEYPHYPSTIPKFICSSDDGIPRLLITENDISYKSNI